MSKKGRLVILFIKTGKHIGIAWSWGRNNKLFQMCSKELFRVMKILKNGIVMMIAEL